MPAVLVEQPDRVPRDARTFAEVTSDGLIAVDRGSRRLFQWTISRRHWWACDVMALAAPFTHIQIPELLYDRLDPLAAKEHLEINIGGQIRDITHANEVVAVIKAAIAAGADGDLHLEGAIATWEPVAPGVTGTCGSVPLPPSPSASLAEQMAATMREPLLSKIDNQGARARRAGCRVAVLLDWTGHADVKQGTHWLAKSPDTVRAAAEDVISSAKGDLDAVYVLDRSDQWHLIYGSFTC